MDKQNQKEKPIDYSKFFEKSKKEKISENGKSFSFANLRNFWSGTSKKTKIELTVLLVLVILIIIVLSVYFL